ncbi:MAG: LysM peptidoglycan-binding domain-containing protein [Candidatus Krumholzibacteriia bacterium]
MAPGPVDPTAPRSRRDAPWRCLLPALLALAAGCAGQRPAPPATALPVVVELAAESEDANGPGEAWWDSLPAPELSPARAAWFAAHPEVAELEDAHRQIVGLLARGLLDPADDLLYLLRKRLAVGATTEDDSLTAVYRQSLDRRLILLAGLLAEEHALRGEAAPADSLLEEAYADIRGLVLPDTLAPVPLEARQAMAELLRLDNDLVQEWIAYFCGPGRKHFDRWLERKAEIEPVVTGILSEAGLPPELLYMSVIESGLNAHARSRVGAVGYWQFMPGTARHFSLRHDTWVDERRDLDRSTRAAATYVTQLYNYFQDWALVLAAYNAGEGRVDRVIRRAGHRDFWRLPLPSETRNHIPKFIAAYRIASDPTRYGFAALPTTPLLADSVRVDEATDLKVIARCAGVPPDTLRALNPALVRGVTPPGGRNWLVRVPLGSGELCRQNLAAVPASERVVWTRHTVRRGDTLGSIAHRYGTDVTQLREANRLSRNGLIHPGDVLQIPQGARGAVAEAAEVAPGASSAPDRAAAKSSPRQVAAATPQGFEQLSYNVRKGDTLSSIARKLGVSLAHLRQVNHLRPGSLIRPGQRLIAHRPAATSRAG